jgi:hypothetical protein
MTMENRTNPTGGDQGPGNRKAGEVVVVVVVPASIPSGGNDGTTMMMEDHHAVPNGEQHEHSSEGNKEEEEPPQPPSPPQNCVAARDHRSSEISGVTEYVSTPGRRQKQGSQEDGDTMDTDHFLNVVAAAVSASVSDGGGGTTTSRGGSFDSAATGGTAPSAGTATSKPSTIFDQRKPVGVYGGGGASPARRDFTSLVTAAAAAAARAEESEQQAIIATTTTTTMTPATSTTGTPPPPPATAAAAAGAANNPVTASPITHPILRKSFNSTSVSSSSSKTTKPSHDRKISWGDTSNIAITPAAAADITSHVSLSSSLSTGGGHNNTKRITDLMKQVNPLEQEAETHLISSIEDMEAMDRSRGEEEKPKLLEFVPQGAEGVFSDFATTPKRGSSRSGTRGSSRSGSSMFSKNKLAAGGGDANNAAAAAAAAAVGDQPSRPTPTDRPPIERPVHRRNKTTVEEDLYSLGNALQALGRPDHPTVAAAVPEEKMLAVGSADRLAANAALLYRRPSKKATEMQLVDIDGAVVVTGQSGADAAATTASANGHGDEASTTSTASPPRTAKTQWKKINTAVFASASLNRRKKTDEEHEGGGTAAVSGGGGGGDRQQQPGDSLDVENGDASAAGTQQANNSAPGSPTSPNGRKKKRPLLSFLRGPLVMVNEYTNEEQRYASVMFFAVLVILVAVACILFYLCGNPPSTYTFVCPSTKRRKYAAFLCGLHLLFLSTTVISGDYHVCI